MTQLSDCCSALTYLRHIKAPVFGANALDDEAPLIGSGAFDWHARIVCHHCHMYRLNSFRVGFDPTDLKHTINAPLINEFSHSRGGRRENWSSTLWPPRFVTEQLRTASRPVATVKLFICSVNSGSNVPQSDVNESRSEVFAFCWIIKPIDN